MSERRTVEFKGAVLAYRKTGTGAEAMLLFHGFGQDSQAFDPLLPSLLPQFTCYSFDLFFHGESRWDHGEQPLEKPFLVQLVDAFLAAEGIGPFHLMGFSLGAKVALAIAESFPDRTRHVFLIAPDGIKTNVWYSLATYPAGLRWVFRRMITHPASFEFLIRMATGLRLADRGLLRFARNQMDTEEKRRRVYYTWVVYRHLKFHRHHLARVFIDQGPGLTVFAGKYDKVITPANLQRLTRLVPKARLVVLEAGHNHLIAMVARHWEAIR